MSVPPRWDLQIGGGPLVAAAIHDGHAVRDEVAAIMALSDGERLQEEDPYTGQWTTVAKTRIVSLHSRFEVDLNRPRYKAVYLIPEDAWGLRVWREEPSRGHVARSLAAYDAFYDEVGSLFTSLQQEYGRFVVLDLHTYNHRRQGPGSPAADPAKNPEVNIGTGSLDRERWGKLVDRFMDELHAFDFLGRHLDVRENVKFQGGHFSRWTHEQFGDSACVLAIEFKKFFMDEWTGNVDANQRAQLEAIPQALAATIPGLVEEVQKL